MQNEGAPKPPDLPPIFEIDISKGWDTASQLEIFLTELKKLPFYKPDLLYSGFGAGSIGITSGSKTDGIIFARTEQSFNDTAKNPFTYATEYDEPAIAIYNPTYMETATYKEVSEAEGYRMKDQRALMAVVRIK